MTQPTGKKFETLTPIDQTEDEFDPLLDLESAKASQLVALNAHLRIIAHIQWATVCRPDSNIPISDAVRAEVAHLFAVGLESMTAGAEEEDPASQG